MGVPRRLGGLFDPMLRRGTEAIPERGRAPKLTRLPGSIQPGALFGRKIMSDTSAATARQATEREFTYPRGWFMVARADELRAGETLSLRFFARKFVAYRTEAGQPVILDSVCPHMGADIAAGGKVDGDGVR